MSTFDAQNIESTSGGAPGFSQGLNVGGSAIGTLITMTEYYSQAGEPSSPANGAVWWDGSVAYQYVGGAWRILSVTPPPHLGDVGIYAGGRGYNGESSSIQTSSIVTGGTATLFGSLSTTRYQLAGGSNGTKGIFAGGIGPSAARTNVMEYITIATTGDASDFGDLPVSQGYGSACGSRNRFIAAGFQSTSGAIYYATFDTPGNAQTFGALTSTDFAQRGASNGTYALWFSSWGNTNTIDYIAIATTGDATDFGDTTVGRKQGGACSIPSRAIYAGGNYSNVIDYVTPTTPGNATDFGDLPIGIRYNSACCNESGKANINGGNRTDGWYGNMYTVDMTTLGNATQYGLFYGGSSTTSGPGDHTSFSGS